MILTIIILTILISTFFLMTRDTKEIQYRDGLPRTKYSLEGKKPFVGPGKKTRLWSR